MKWVCSWAYRHRNGRRGLILSFISTESISATSGLAAPPESSYLWTHCSLAVFKAPLCDLKMNNFGDPEWSYWEMQQSVEPPLSWMSRKQHKKVTTKTLRQPAAGVQWRPIKIQSWLAFNCFQKCLRCCSRNTNVLLVMFAPEDEWQTDLTCFQSIITYLSSRKLNFESLFWWFCFIWTLNVSAELSLMKNLRRWKTRRC